MKNEIQRLLARIDEKPTAGKIGVAVSGGCDSVAMLLLLNNWARISGRRICVFHVDHGLRDESGNDREWVKNLADNLGLEYFCRIARNVDADDISQSGGKEAWARKFRYFCFAEMAREAEIKIIATGHTCDDQLETVLMRLFAGTSLQGAGGIRQMRRFAIEGTEIHLWRPLLKIRRFELENFLHENGQSWLTDQTNFSDEFLRNAVRQNIVPEIEKLFPRAGLKIQSLIYDIQEVQTLIEEQARGFLCKNVTDDKKTLKLKELAPVIKREVLRLWLLDLGFKREITRNLIERLVDLWETKSKGRRLDHRKFKFERTVENIIFID